MWRVLLVGLSLFITKEDVFVFENLIPDTRVVVNTPCSSLIDRELPTRVIFYALPNGNTIEQTAGKLVRQKNDPLEWRYDIQHIAAQTRFLRDNDHRYNYIVVYLEASMKAWTSHSAKYPDSPKLYCHLVDTICTMLTERLALKHSPEVALSSHSGGGRFIFSYINGVEEIPAYVKRIVFIDSSYGYEDSLHAKKLTYWLKRSKDNSLAVFSYVDTTVRMNGKPIVSSFGGTGYRSRMMARTLAREGIKLKNPSDTIFKRFIGSGQYKGRVQILIKENPTGQIYHTVLVERNGLIHSMLMGSPLEEKKYKFWGERAYTEFIE